MKAVLKAITLSLFLCVFCGQIEAQVKKSARVRQGGAAAPAATGGAKTAPGKGAKPGAAAGKGTGKAPVRKAAPGTPEARAQAEADAIARGLDPKAPSVLSSMGVEPQDQTYEGKDVETLPAFRGGELAMLKFISTHLQYPKDHPARDVEGKVIVRFVVDKTGLLHGFEIVESLGESFDEEAMNVLKKMPRWTPGRYRGKPANVYRQLPIIFK